MPRQRIHFRWFSRTTAQAEALDAMLSSKGTSINMMLSLEVDDEELIKRLLNRGKDSGRPMIRMRKSFENV